MRPESVYLSCIVPVYNEGAGVRDFLRALWQTLQTLSDHCEIVVINDGSKDDTAATIAGMCGGDMPLRLINFSRNFGKEAALTAGLDVVEGDVAIMIDADFQHPLATLPAFMARWREGYDMVYGVRSSRADEAAFKRAGAKAFYGLINWLSSVDIPPDAGDFRLLDRKVIDALKAMPERARFMKGMYAWVGFRSIPVTFEVAARSSGVSTFNMRSLLRLAQVGILAFSDLPLRVWSVIGFGISALSFAYGLWVIINTLVFGVDVPGWATLAAAMMFLGGVQLLSIGILGEYLAGVFNEVKQRPTYLIAERVGYPLKQSDQT